MLRRAVVSSAKTKTKRRQKKPRREAAPAESLATALSYELWGDAPPKQGKGPRKHRKRDLPLLPKPVPLEEWARGRAGPGAAASIRAPYRDCQVASLARAAATRVERVRNRCRARSRIASHGCGMQKDLDAAKKDVVVGVVDVRSDQEARLWF